MMDDDIILTDDPISFSNSQLTNLTIGKDQIHSSVGYAIDTSTRFPTTEGQLGDWSALQGFITNRDIRVISLSSLDFHGSGCMYIDEGKSFVVKTARLSDEQDFSDPQGKIVAVKLVKPFDTHEKLENVCLEILALTHPPLREHHHIIDFIGLTWTTEDDDRLEPALIVEFAEYGSLDKYLSSHTLNIAAKVDICAGIADGLDVLHQCAVIHGDVKCENVLVFQGPDGIIVPKLSDFGFSLVLPNIQRKEQIVGTFRWNAPELCTGDTSSFSKDPDHLPLLDIYSYGLLVWRVLKNGLDPFDNIATEDVVFLKAFSNEPLSRACQYLHSVISNNNESSYLGIFERVFKETLPLDPSSRCRHLGWIKIAFSFDEPRKSEIEARPIRDQLSLPQSLGARLTEILLQLAIQNAQLPWELKESMFRQATINAEVATSHDDVFLLALFYGLGFGTAKSYEKMFEWCIKAASQGSPAAKALIIPMSKLAKKDLPTDLPMSKWLLEAVEKLTNTHDTENLIAFRVIKQFYLDIYPQARSLYKEKTRVYSIVEVSGSSATMCERVWETPSNVHEEIIASIKVRFQSPENVLRFACIEGDEYLAYEAIRELQADVNTIPEYRIGGTPIMLAVRNGNYRLAERLVTDFHADVRPNLTDNTGRDTLVVAIESAAGEESESLENFCQLVIKEGEYITFEALLPAFEAACVNQTFSLLALVLRSFDYSHLSIAEYDEIAKVLMTNHQYRALDLFLSRACSFQYVPSSVARHISNWPPLLCFVNHGDEYFTNIVETLNVLVKWGADINRIGDSPSSLMTAVIMGHGELVKELINRGADPLKPEPAFEEASAFYVSIGANFSNPDAFNIILSHCGSLPLEVSNMAMALAPFSRPYGLEYVQSLYDTKLFDVSIQCGPSSSLLHQIIFYGFKSQSIVEFLLENGATVDAHGLNGITPLFCALQIHKLGIARLLLTYGASLTYRGPQGLTPLHAAAVVEDNGEMMNLLLEMASEININIQDDIGFTPLHSAAESGNAGAVSVLLSRDANNEVRDAKGRTPIDIAKIALENTKNNSGGLNRRKKYLCTKIVDILGQKKTIAEVFPQES